MVRYPYYAAKIAGAVSRGEADRGILICSTGIGMSILANRFKGVRACHCAPIHIWQR
ncbi:MAG: RpiB/LacA/LacB family sugar-phosphate isomerase [Enterocloster sp.]|uniref:RpiB/LacA/LacB family sugar-phosphate isomerase n=1 Tax=Enterocloster sp. TaxID=2719315 RepID=UPI003999F124